MANKIIQASIDENGKAKGGKAGDQTGKEVNIANWYKNNWNNMIRCISATYGAKAAAIAQKLAKSNIVGYDQTIAPNDGRNTLYKALKKYDFNVDEYIASGEKSECDCSSFVYAVYCCLYKELRSDSNAPTTSSWPDFAKAHPKVFKVYTASKYLTTDANLRAGDLIDKTGAHIVMFAGSTTAASVKYFRACKKGYSSIVDALISVGAVYESKSQFKTYRKQIAVANGLLTSTSGFLTASVNKKMRELLEQGKLIQP